MRLALRRGLELPWAVALAVLALVGSGLAWWALGSRRAGQPRRPPAAVANLQAKPAAEFVVGRVRHVIAPDAPQRLLPDTTFPTSPVRLLWLQGRAASPLPDGGSAVLDGAGGVIVFRPDLSQRRPALPTGRQIASVARTREALWLTDADGSVLRLSPGGALQATSREPIRYPAVAADPKRDDVWLVRRPDYWEYRLPDPGAPLLLHLARGAPAAEAVGSVIVPHERLLTEFANAGHIAVAGDTVYFAPFLRDEIIAFAASGDTLWVTRRRLPQATPEPRFVVTEGTAMIDYHPVNLGAVVGPDDRLYVLSTPGFTTQEARLDVLDRFSGRLLRSARLAESLPTLAADAAGRVYALDAFRLLTGTHPAERPAFPSFDLEQLGGGRMTSEQLHGKVTLINFWASWCGPCRQEMPALDSLRHSIADPDFQFITMNEDQNPADAAAFVRQFGFDFPVLLGRGALRQKYHYLGLPFTVLVDRGGRVVQRWVGFAGAAQIQAERALVRAELDREAATAPAHGSAQSPRGAAAAGPPQHHQHHQR